MFGGLTDGGHDGGGGRQRQGAGAKYDQDGYAPVQRRRHAEPQGPVEKKSARRDHKGDGDKPNGPLICDALHRSFFLLRLLNQTDHLLQGSIFSDAGGGKINGAKAVYGPAKDLVSNAFVSGNGFPG